MSAPGRVVVRYAGAQIVDCRERIRIQFEAEPVKGVRWPLRYHGFQSVGNGGYEAPMNPSTIAGAQEIMNTWYGSELK